MINDAISSARKALGIAERVDVEEFGSIVAFFEHCCQRYASQKVFTSLGHSITYAELDALSADFASYLQQHTDLVPGDRIAIQLPNIVQFPVALFGALRAGLVVVNTNPLYSERELEHQFKDSGAKAVVVLANVAKSIEEVVVDLGIKNIIVTDIADLHPFPKRQLINFAVRYIKRMVPSYSLPTATSFRDVLSLGAKGNFTPVSVSKEQLAVLQYTGGTTGVAKGAMLSHANLLANTLQSAEIFKTYGFKEGDEAFIAPLPLYHIYAFTVSMIMMKNGAHSILIPNPRDIRSMVKAMAAQPFSGLCGLNTLFVSLCEDEGFRNLDFSNLKMTLSGGMALTKDAAEEWQRVTGCEVFEGYGLTETSPVVSVNPGGGNKIGTIGLPVPNTEVKVIDSEGNSLDVGEAGELLVKGPQVMEGYWQRPEATDEVMTDGWLHTGDIAVIGEDGYLKIVDRKKDMIIVSGFNVYPNEVENLVSQHPQVLECAVIGVPSEESGEDVMLFVVAKDHRLTEKDLISYCRSGLARYKVPSIIEFRDSLPKSNVGKVLRKELRAEYNARERN